MTLVGRPDAAYGNESTPDKCRLGLVIELTASSLRGPFQNIHRASKSTRKLARSSPGGEAYAFSEMADHMAMLRELYAHVLDVSPGMVGIEGCESLFAHLKNKKPVAEKFLVRRLLAIQQTLGAPELDNANGLPGLANPAGGLTKTKIDMVPTLLLESGT